MRQRSIWIGFEPREAAAFAVARQSIASRLSQPIPVRPVILRQLMRDRLYTRPTDFRLGRFYDRLSIRPDYNGELSTEFANSRFLVPHLAKTGLALFMDCDMLVRCDLAELFDACERDPGKAVYCVQHDHRPSNDRKMDDRIQTGYSRKNWSSVMVIDCDHAANRSLTLDLINTAPGRDLHRFCWLADCDIGALGAEWNWLVGHSDPQINPKIVHHTDGGPCLPGFERVAFADEWFGELENWANAV